MSAEAAERYYSRRERVLAERRARQEEWDYAAQRLDDQEVSDRVGHGWRRLLLELHDALLTLDPSYRLYAIEEDLGGLVVTARFAPLLQAQGARLIQVARAKALATCEVCGRPGMLRAERVQMKTLCDDCWSADRAAAATHGERFADAVLAQLLSSDRDHPSPEDVIAWLDELDAS